MGTPKLLQAIAVALMLMTTPVIAQEKSILNGFDGRWEGTINIIPPDTFDKEHGLKGDAAHLAIAIKGEAVSVYSNLNNCWGELLPGGFRIVPHKTNAVIFMHNSALEESDGKAGGWVETWNLTLTHRDDKSLYVMFARSVNNVGLGPDEHVNDASGRMFVMGFGKFDRVSDVKIP